MSTELKSSSKAYDLTSVGLKGYRVGIVVGNTAKPGVARTLDTESIVKMFLWGDFTRLQNDLDLLDETMELLIDDLANFVISRGDGMEAY